MSGSTESKQTEKRVTRAAFVPRTTGIFVLLIIILSFIAGAVRRELVLTLVGAVFFAVWAWCLLMTLLLALIHGRRARRISIRLTRREIAVGEQTEIVCSGETRAAFFRLPGILIRCRLSLRTRDGRLIRHDFDPGIAAPEPLAAGKRGAYFSRYDEFAIFDALGFFRFAFRLPLEHTVRLLVSPRAAGEAISTKARSGESGARSELTFQRTDNLIDHRPYVPGDDPRRINWKLYGHGGELFVREGEREPPPHANILIIVDGQFDPLLYSGERAADGVDLLCENALAAALACVESGQDVQIARTRRSGDGEDIPEAVLPGNTPSELAAVLAWPAALPWSIAAELPSPPEDRGVLILALPRAHSGPSALDSFVRDFSSRGAGRTKSRTVELLFLYGNGPADSGGNTRINELAAAAETCAAMYNRRPGIRAWAMGCGAARSLA